MQDVTEIALFLIFPLLWLTQVHVVMYELPSLILKNACKRPENVNIAFLIKVEP